MSSTAPPNKPAPMRLDDKRASLRSLANHILVGMPCGVPQQRGDDQHTTE
jgi:hypothetical protein